LDEIHEDKRLLFEEVLNEFSAMYPGNIYIVSMRTLTFESQNRLSAFKPFILLPWTTEQITSFVTHQIPDSRADSINSYLTENPKIKFLAKNPLFLSVLVKTYSKNEKIPVHPGVLVGLYVDRLIIDGASLMIGISPLSLKDFFMNVAVIMKEKKASTLEKSEVVAVLEKITGKSTSYVLAILNGIENHSGFFVANGQGKFTFINDLFLEYFSNPYQQEG
jgi:hypothetical protein